MILSPEFSLIKGNYIYEKDFDLVDSYRRGILKQFGFMDMYLHVLSTIYT